MDNRKFLTGLGIGMIAGGTIGMMMAPQNRRDGRKMLSRALKNMGDVIDDVSCVFGR
ncbi:MAG: YtxH domain-containing protein [Oscillospiraceae bacterium]|nr:YtxH domain-containing protein [Oscillospiraceae bacterium]